MTTYTVKLDYDSPLLKPSVMKGLTYKEIYSWLKSFNQEWKLNTKGQAQGFYIAQGYLTIEEET